MRSQERKQSNSSMAKDSKNSRVQMKKNKNKEQREFKKSQKNCLAPETFQAQIKKDQQEKIEEITIEHKESGFPIIQMTQLTQQTNNELRKYLKSNLLIFQRDLQLFRTFQSSIIFIKLAYIFLLALSFIIYPDEEKETGEMTYFNYQNQTCPLKKESKFHLSFIFTELAGFYLIFKAFSQYIYLSEKERKKFSKGLLLIVFTSYLLQFNNFNEYLVIILKALAIIMFTTIFIKNTQRNTSIELYILLLITFLGWIFISFTFSKTLKAPKYQQIFLGSIYFILAYAMILIYQLIAAIKYYKRVRTRNDLTKKVESVYHMMNSYFFVIINLCVSSRFFLIGSNEVRISQYPDISLQFYFRLAWILHESVVFIFVLSTMRTIQEQISNQNYRYLISESLISPNEYLLNGNQQINIGQCYICLSEPARFSYQTCGHLYCGNNCVKICLEQSVSHCPICRIPSKLLTEIRKVDEKTGKNRKFEIINKYQFQKI